MVPNREYDYLSFGVENFVGRRFYLTVTTYKAYDVDSSACGWA